MNRLGQARALPHAATLGAMAVGLSVLVLIRWSLNLELFNSVLRGKVLMMPWPAAGFLLLAASLSIQAHAARKVEGPSPANRSLALSLALAALTIGLITLVEFLTAWDPGFDLLLFRDAVVLHSKVFPGRMSPVAAIVQSALAVSLVITAWKRPSGVAAALALMAIVAGLTGISGHLYGADTMFSVAGYPPPSLVTAALFLIVGMGSLTLQPDQRVLAPFINRHGGGTMGRRLLPAVIAMPMVLGWIRLQLQLAGWYGSRVGFALYTCANIISFAVLIWWSARLLNNVDEDREASEHRARTTLAESERRYRTLAESLPQMIWTCLPDGTRDYVNPQSVRYAGIPEAEQLGNGWSALIHPDDLPLIAAQWAWSVEHGELLDIETRVRRSDGVYRWFRTLAHPLRDHTGNIVKWFGSNTDIDDRKSAEADFQELANALEQRVEERTAELLAAKEQAESADRLKTDFILTMSHELRTPLNSIIGFTATLLTKLPGPLSIEQEKQLRIVQTSGRHLLMLINDVLDVAKIESGTFDHTPLPLDAVQVMRGVAAELTPLADNKGLVIEMSSNAPAIPLTSDVRALRQVLINFVSNAIKFTERGTIALSAATVNNAGSTSVELSVRDSGIGIDATDLPKLFTKFGRLHDARSGVGGGTGLGLYLCKLITTQLGARIRVDSEPGRGSTFTVVFEQRDLA